MAKNKNWQPISFPKLIWDEGKLEEPLDELCQYAIATAEQARQWYEDWRPRKKYSAWLVRVLAILATGAAGIIPLLGPILSEATGNQSGVPGINPLWSSVALAIAALFVLFDRFWGFSSAWVRYLHTAQELAHETDRFRMQIEKAKLAWMSSGPTSTTAKEMIDMCESFVGMVHEIVGNETKDWATEFRAAIKQIDAGSKPSSQRKP